MKDNRLFFAAIGGLLVCAFLVFLARFDNHPVHATDQQIRVLFIGNSYTFVNNLPKLLETISAQETRPIQADSVTEGGITLKKQWQDGKALAAIQRGNWDYVVLQEHSTFGSTAVVNNVAQLNGPDDFYAYARLFDAAIKKVGAKTLFFMTWARENSPQNQAIIANRYMTIADELRDDVAPVGLAWANSLQTRPTLKLHQADMSHPDSDGSYLAACVFYAEMYHKSPVGLTSHIADHTNSGLLQSVSGVSSAAVDLDQRDASFLQTIAWKTVEDQREPTAQPVSTAAANPLP